MKKPKQEKQAPKPQISREAAILELAKRGKKENLPQLRELLAERPEIWQSYGDLGKQAQQSWIEMLGGKNLLLKECVARFLEDMKKSLGGNNPTALERLLVDRIASCWLHTQWCEMSEAQRPGGENLITAAFYLKRQELAHKQLVGAAKTLATIRKLLPQTIEVQVRTEQPHQNASPATNGDGGYQAVNGKPHVNGVKLNGHSRFGHLLETVGAGGEG